MVYFPKLCIGVGLLFDWDKFYTKIFDDNNDQYENIMEYMLKYVL